MYLDTYVHRTEKSLEEFLTDTLFLWRYCCLITAFMCIKISEMVRLLEYFSDKYLFWKQIRKISTGRYRTIVNQQVSVVHKRTYLKLVNPAISLITH